MLKGAPGLNFFFVGLPASRVYTPAKKIQVILFNTLCVFIRNKRF